MRSYSPRPRHRPMSLRRYFLGELFHMPYEISEDLAQSFHLVIVPSASKAFISVTDRTERLHDLLDLLANETVRRRSRMISMPAFSAISFSCRHSSTPSKPVQARQ